jgi:hypothetical protein
LSRDLGNWQLAERSKFHFVKGTFMALARVILMGENPWTMAMIANTTKTVTFIIFPLQQ